MIGPAGIVSLFSESALSDFCTAFEESGLHSIDSFLARRPQFQEIGKQCIAAFLLHCEASAGRADSQTDWYGILWNQISTERVEDLDLSWLSVVTFNYDRSLEQYLHKVVMASYGVDSATAVERLRTLRIIHVYGALGDAYPGDPKYLDRAGGPVAKRVALAASCLRVIPEQRTDGQSDLERAIALLRPAERVGILGFGFDQVNLSRLRASETFAFRVGVKGERIAVRRVVATCLGMTAAEAEEAGKACGIGPSIHVADGPMLPQDFFPVDCVGLLRQTLILRP